MIRVNKKQKELLCSPEVSLEAAALEKLEKPIMQALSEKNWKTFKMNLEKVTDIDADGLIFMLSLWKSVQNSKRNFEIVNCSDQLQKLFDAIHLVEQFSVEGVYVK
ncbi:MAG: STAS domain-containing protein [SAR324 cluster bacterium]|nr:STAS domain-containing protein [SAR324 cluster bacterium]